MSETCLGHSALTGRSKLSGSIILTLYFHQRPFAALFNAETNDLQHRMLVFVCLLGSN
jgi:hypothetical protein